MEILTFISGNKETKITYSNSNLYTVRINQKSESGLFNELVLIKFGYKTFKAAEKFALKQ